MAACMSWEGEKGREMAEVRWRSYFLSVGVILPLTAVLSAAWMEVDPVSWGDGGGKRKKKKIECTALEELQVLMTIRKIHQNQDLPYLFTNLQLLCDGLIANSWLHGEDKAFRGRTVLICSAEQADHLSSLQRNRQLTHPPPSAKQEISQAFLNGRKIKPKPLATYWALLFRPCPSNSTHVLTQVLQTPFDRILQSQGSKAALLTHLAQRKHATTLPHTYAQCVKADVEEKNLLVMMRRHVTFNKHEGEGCPFPCCLLWACLD